MALDAPVTVHGEQLRRKREGYGVQQKDIALVLGHHRNTIRAWEQASVVDVRRQRLYLGALRQLVEKGDPK